MKAHKALKYIVLALVFALGLVLLLPKGGQEATRPRDWTEIASSDTLRATTEYNQQSYFASGDSVTGFHYELLQAFAHSHGLTASIVPEMSHEKRLEGLAEGRFDVVAYGIPTTTELRDSLAFTRPILLDKQILVQRRDTAPAGDSLFVGSLLELAGRTVHVVKGSPAILRIHNLEDEIGDTIYIKEMEQYGTEQLVALVAHGDINYAICEEEIAASLADDLPQIDITTAIGFTQFYSWAVNKHSTALLDSLNTWLDSYLKTKECKSLYRKYGKHIP